MLLISCLHFIAARALVTYAPANPLPHARSRSAPASRPSRLLAGARLWRNNVRPIELARKLMSLGAHASLLMIAHARTRTHARTRQFLANLRSPANQNDVTIAKKCAPAKTRALGKSGRALTNAHVRARGQLLSYPLIDLGRTCECIAFMTLLIGSRETRAPDCNMSFIFVSARVRACARAESSYVCTIRTGARACRLSCPI